MAQTPEGALLLASQKAGVTVDEYKQQLALGNKWCWRCRLWKSNLSFGKDASRFDGLASACFDCRKAIYRKCYIPKPRPRGRRFTSPRNGDKKQARSRANHLAHVGLLPKPNSRPCADCGHVWKPGERRHEFDHHQGYSTDKHESVEIVCSKCHHRRHPNTGRRRKRTEK